ncbi:hypothetical protein B4U45_07550 [Mycobacterium persicum]|uniref:Uncharacterized protein n=1 Tax=Mycobacterium persicum TaxID=1487726 RepID=A0A8E2INX5_9MYCO|nr:hypothetical protein BST40_16175 [Mycobacterium persicum]ORB89045.1 hypothetical protein B1T49_07090 [Mycobacterium persicum]ORB94417.1 hypothetical protein B1T44_07665 [Mycobacterium persicum]ORC01103.1 hypothetical protein B1T48_07055 [Mycobacterium persicum]ORC06502.1 hypothetical protein B4U45_07550 [Mycobacterium persicum]
MTSALESSIHMSLSVGVTLKESLSHDSENGGNSYPWVGCASGVGTPFRRCFRLPVNRSGTQVRE